MVAILRNIRLRDLAENVVTDPLRPTVGHGGFPPCLLTPSSVPRSDTSAQNVGRIWHLDKPKRRSLRASCSAVRAHRCAWRFILSDLRDILLFSYHSGASA